MKEKIKTFVDILEGADKIVYFTGAGVSTGAGIPDFRSETGLYSILGKTMDQPEQMLSHRFFKENPVAFYDFQWTYMYHPEIQPSIAHEFPVFLEKQGKEVAVITQNADGLHQRAGANPVYALHGNQYDFYCTECGTSYTYDELQLDEDDVPRCPKDQALVRSTAVLFGESLDPAVLDGAIQALKRADVLIVAGTSLNVYPASGLVHYFAGDHTVIVNQEALPLSQNSVLTIQADIDQVLTQVQDQMTK